MNIASITIDLEGVNFNNAYLRGANLEGINMFEAKLSGAHFEEAHLEGAELISASINGAHFEGAHLNGAHLKGIRDFNNAHFEGADCNNIVLNRSVINGAHFEGAILTEISCVGVTFGQSYFEGANFRNATFIDCRFVNTHFMSAHFDGATFTNCISNNANFTGAHLNRVHFSGGNFTNAIMSEVNFEGAVIEEQTFFNLDELSPEQRGHLGPLLVEEARPVVHGVAFEIHNLFGMLNLNRIRDFLDDFNKHHAEVNPNTVSEEDGEEPHLFKPLLAFIDNSNTFLPSEKEQYKTNLQTRVLPRVYGYGDFANFASIFNSVMKFVCRQNDSFIEEYIRIYSKDCLFAYSGANTDSCTKGMIERIITTLNEVASNFLLDFPDIKLYRDLRQLFPTIVFNDVVQEWAGKYLEGGDNESELTAMNPLQRKQHFIEYMKNKYGGLLTQAIDLQINAEANQYFSTGVFDRMAFGIRSKKYRKNHKKTKKRNLYTKRIGKNVAKKKLTKIAKKKLTKRYK